MGFFRVHRQVFWQNRHLMRQKMIPPACFVMWQAMTPCG